MLAVRQEERPHVDGLILAERVAAVGTPPAADTLWRADVDVGAKTITPSRFHVPARGSGASHNVMGGPPETSIFLSFPPAKNPMNRLSGDQKGWNAPSVPASDCAARVSSERTQSCDLPSAPAATMAI